ncbi:hypothetical protein K503DRAFT_787589 [Rhizopogon vinicolor AM-OR11-026]|uniref:DUF6533 domain-containing protein n=1 Tax=Rhizopogon vinicolor AM-OR11-026 TaxID=1314800 RepID=A0A1B7MGU8_9AGAM|nr:hypothetical protein K503DRAFT_787589 [Rhizopogon vinicolor AM-OR11-026]
MTIISNDPTLWPVIGFYRINGYYAIASSIVVVYDWILTFGQEFDQIWVRYIGLLVAGSCHVQFPHAVLPTSLNYRYRVSKIVNRLVRYHDFDSCEIIRSIHSADAYPVT